MAETLEKLSPDRDLQCYYFQPSAIAVLSGASPDGYVVSGTWRQQFDWAVVEWNRDNVFEHPAFRYLPDGDLSGLTLSYRETRVNCIPLDSPLFATVDWPTLRIWADPGTGEQIYYITLHGQYAAPVQGSYVAATASLTLGGTPTSGDYIGVSFLEEQYNYQLLGVDTIDSAVAGLAAAVHAFSTTMDATANGAAITLTYKVANQGSAGNRIGAYGFVSGARTENWQRAEAQFSGGQSPSQWQITLPFGTLVDNAGRTVPATSIRKMRWTYAADLQAGPYVRGEFQVQVTNWAVTGTGRAYLVAGSGSSRIEDDSTEVHYSGSWARSSGNFSGSTIHYTATQGDSLSCSYTSAQTHGLYLGTRITFNGGTISVVVDGQAAVTVNLLYSGEDTLVRHPLGQLAAGRHTIVATYTGATGNYFYFDFLEIAISTADLPVLPTDNRMTLATDWDTLHSQALAPERTAWMIYSLGFRGRANHYAGALWFYELVASVASGSLYSSGTVTFQGTPDFGPTTQISIGRVGLPQSQWTVFSHQNVIGETVETLAIAFALLINNGTTGIWAQASGGVVTIYSRAMGLAGNLITMATSPNTAHLTILTSGGTLAGALVDPTWLTDLQAAPRINRGARDWSVAYFTALKAYGIDVTASFSTELGNGDPSVAAGIAQRYPNGDAVIVSTPALQTNFSPASLAYWEQVYAGMAALQAQAGLVPYVQFGEVQWWYFTEDPLIAAGMPFYDLYTTSTFQARYGRPMAVILSNQVNPATVPDEAAFLPSLIGAHTAAIQAFVRTVYSNCRFEVLYPNDVNATPLNVVINYPTAQWTAQNLTCLKTESFGYTLSRNLNLARQSIEQGHGAAFAASQRSHLIGVSDATTAWLKEARIAEGDGFESVVLWALDQFCLVGYATPLSPGLRRAVAQG